MLAGSLDTNALVRLIVQDDDRQTQAVARLLSKYANKPESIFVAITVILELEWVLRSRYKFSKPNFVTALSSLLMADEFAFESEGGLEQALSDYTDGDADFADYLHLALSRQRKALPFWTFDTTAARADGARLLKTS